MNLEIEKVQNKEMRMMKAVVTSNESGSPLNYRWLQLKNLCGHFGMYHTAPLCVALQLNAKLTFFNLKC